MGYVLQVLYHSNENIYEYYLKHSMSKTEPFDVYHSVSLFTVTSHKIIIRIIMEQIFPPSLVSQIE